MCFSNFLLLQACRAKQGQRQAVFGGHCRPGTSRGPERAEGRGVEALSLPASIGHPGCPAALRLVMRVGAHAHPATGLRADEASLGGITERLRRLKSVTAAVGRTGYRVL